jgi:hypothetical protein
MRGFGVVPCWHISLKIGSLNVAKKSKKAKRGAPARKKKGMNKAKSAKRATVTEARPGSDASITANSGTADPRWLDRRSIDIRAVTFCVQPTVRRTSRTSLAAAAFDNVSAAVFRGALVQ